jgi:hypothetical protein
MSKIYGALVIVYCIVLNSVNAQNVSYKTFGDGLRVMANDSSFSMKMEFRFQTLYSGVLNLESDKWTDQMLVRRARLKFDGFALSPRLVYKVELGLSNRDLAGGSNVQTGFTSRLILDAVLKWNFHSSWTLWVGQTKLPGNRERVISSQNLQFVDRSLVNSRFTLDRDIGIQIRHQDKVGSKGLIREIFSVSMGEGRNIITPNIGGYDYTFRFEYLPLGAFTSKGDYFSADLKREQSPKLAVGVSYDFNHGAGKQRGQLGLFMIDSLGNQYTNDLHTIFVDAIFKYRGLSFQTEYANKTAKDNIIVASEQGDLRYGTGSGFVFQGGFLFPSDLELGARYTRIRSDSEEYSSIREVNEYTLGISRYFKGHNLKIQSDLSYRERLAGDNFLQFRLQVELAI